MLAILITAIIGLILSSYAVYVERMAKKDANFKPYCDISDLISCTKAFTSKYGTTLSLPNGVWGLIFYTIIIILSIVNYSTAILYVSILSVVGSIYLASILYFKLHDLCIVCTGIYVVNIALLIFSLI